MSRSSSRGTIFCNGASFEREVAIKSAPKLNFNADKIEMAASDVGEVPHDSLLQSDPSQKESGNRKVEAEFPKFVTTYDEAYRIIERYENSSTSKFVQGRKNKEFGNEGEYILVLRIS